MATKTGRTRCVTCGKEKATFKCGGCTKEFCYNHLGDHKQELNKQLDGVEVNCDLFRQKLMEQKPNSQKNSLIVQIDEWERNSMKTIRQTANDARELVLKHTSGYIKELEAELNKLTKQLRQSREENDFFETDLHRWNSELSRFSKELDRPSNVKLRQDTSPFISKILVDITSVSPCRVAFGTKVRWIQNGITIAGDNGRGNQLNQFSGPWGICVDDNQTVYVADCSNDRIVEWKSSSINGQVVVGGCGRGNRTDQLDTPTDMIIDKKSDCFLISDYGNRRVVRWHRQKDINGQTIISNVGCWSLAMDNDGNLYVADYDKSEVRRWQIGDTTGTVVAGGNGKGNRLDQLSDRFYIFVDGNKSVYVSEEGNNRVTKWVQGAKEGIVVAGGRSAGNSLAQLSSPIGIIVDYLGTVYVADMGNHRIVRWPVGASEGTIVAGGYGKGRQAYQLFCPLGIAFDRQSNLYVVDSGNCRVQKFNIVSDANV